LTIIVLEFTQIHLQSVSRASGAVVKSALDGSLVRAGISQRHLKFVALSIFQIVAFIIRDLTNFTNVG
jgi:hypothetical protein